MVYPDYAVQDDTTQAYLTDTVANMLFYRRADGFRPTVWRRIYVFVLASCIPWQDKNLP